MSNDKGIETIADTCSADVLLSLDHFYTRNGVTYFSYNNTAHEAVEVHYSWTAYDLNSKKLVFHFSRGDTISWSHGPEYKKPAMKKLPPRRDAVLNAADIAGCNTAEFLVPHWKTVQRMIYNLGHPELQAAKQLVEQGKWLEAAEVWKRHVDSKNKTIEAACKYNMAVASEMNDKIDLALNWVVDSYHVFGEKNEIHALNCRDYIRILSLRMRDVNIMEQQFESTK